MMPNPLLLAGLVALVVSVSVWVLVVEPRLDAAARRREAERVAELIRHGLSSSEAWSVTP